MNAKTLEAVTRHGETDAEREANARLIASAPELLAALLDSADAIDSVIINLSTPEIKDALRSVNARNRAAIAKATPNAEPESTCLGVLPPSATLGMEGV
jgi:hypothetical protein